ncbi:MAG TPA: hypothetical protein VNO14_06215, partial [Blastocatellia bacterium]|nr:hypothetical protein [Blastocatellia bacterium]
PATRSEVDDRVVKLLKDYYDGRRSTVVGAVSLPLGLAVLTLLLAMDWMDRMPVIGLFGLGCLIYGAIALIAGIAGWIESTSEMKALEIATGRTLIPRSGREALPAAPVEITTAAAKNYSTDPIALPASITEHTTRQLEQEAITPSMEGQSKSGE